MTNADKPDVAARLIKTRDAPSLCRANDAVVPVTARANCVELTYWSDLEQLAKRVALDLTS